MSHENPQKIQAVSKIMHALYNGAQLLRTKSIQLMNMKKLSKCPHETLIPCLFGVVLCRSPKEKCKHQSRHKTFSLHFVLAQYAREILSLGQRGYRTCGSSQLTSDLTSNHKMELITATAWGTKNQRLDSLET